MNVRVPVLVGLIILGLAMSAVAGSDNAKKLIGVWEITKSESAPPGATVEFTKDGKIKLMAKFGDKEIAIEGTYKVKDATIAVVLGAGGKAKEDSGKILKLTEKELHIEVEKGKVDEYKRVK